MPRPLLIRSPNLPCHVRARSNNKDWFYLPPKEIWDIFSSLWNEAIERFGVRLHAFVLMSNHFHVLLSTPNDNLDEVMLYFMREADREVNRRTERINPVFGAPYKWNLIDNAYYYKTVTRYVYQNPVKAGICKRVEDYPWSTIHFWIKGLKAYPLNLSESCFERESVMDLLIPQKLEWLNTPYHPSEYDLIKKGLTRARFAIRRANTPAPILAQFHPKR